MRGESTAAVWPLLLSHMEGTSQDQPSGDDLETCTRLLADGDEAAWRWFHERYYLSLLRYATHRSGDASAAGEIVQLAYLRIARHAKVFTTEADFWGWLCCLVRCTALDHTRRVTRRSALMERFAHWRASRATDAADGPPSEHSARALADEALARLPAEDAALLRSKYCDELTTDELAASLGVTPKALEHRLARLRGRLRDIILRLR